MTEASQTGIALIHGDCPQGVAQPKKLQAKTCQKSEHGEEQSLHEGISISFVNYKDNFEDKYSQGDHATLSQRTKNMLEVPCVCCRRCYFNTATEEKQPSRVMYWEVSKPKFGGISVTKGDYRAHKVQRREVPKWHPHYSQPWRWLDATSVTETTYRKDFTPPVIVNRRLPLRSWITGSNQQ